MSDGYMKKSKWVGGCWFLMKILLTNPFSGIENVQNAQNTECHTANPLWNRFSYSHWLLWWVLRDEHTEYLFYFSDSYCLMIFDRFWLHLFSKIHIQLDLMICQRIWIIFEKNWWWVHWYWQKLIPIMYYPRERWHQILPR